MGDVNYLELRFTERIERLFARLESELSDAFDFSRELPSMLWHYTSADGVRSIIDTSRLRFSHARFLNDPTEIAFGWDEVTKALQHAIDSATNLKNFFAMTRSVAGDVYNAGHFFTFCLSARTDSLSQWRAYGAGGEGYAVGFDSSLVQSSTESDAKCTLLQLRYSDSDRSALLRRGIDATIRFWQELLTEPVAPEHKEGIAGRANVHLSRFMMLAALSFKHPSFEDEHEWRLVISIHPGDRDSEELQRKVEFRAGIGIVKPYIDLPAASTTMKRLPITKIMFGPTLRPTVTRESIQFLLNQRGYGHVPVDPSDVPLQV
jgi:Protein of unknown function (DUF2971)